MSQSPFSHDDTKQADHLRGLQMEAGRAKAAVERAQAALDECLAAGQPETAARKALKEAKTREDTLNVKVRIFKQGAIKAAEARELDAARQDAEREQYVLSQLHSVGQQVDHQMATLADLVTRQLIPLMNDARSLPNEAFQPQLTAASLSFYAHLLEGVKAMPKCDTGLGVFLRRLGNAPWSASLPKPKGQP